MLTRLSPWWQAARPIAHGMIALPLLWGQAIALSQTGAFHWGWFAFIHGYGMLCQIYILYLNDYADEAVDRLNDGYWFSGGSRVIPNALLSGKHVYRASFVIAFALLLLATIAMANDRPWAIPLIGASLFAAWNYSLKPMRSSYRGIGELHQGMSCGVLLPVIAFYLQTGHFAGFPWRLLLPFGLIFFAGNIVTALMDTAADTQGGKRTYPVRHGEYSARRDALLILLVAYALTAKLNLSNGMPWPMTMLTVGPALLLLIYIERCGLLKAADSVNRNVCKRFILLTSLSQLWVLILWTISFVLLTINS